MTALLHPQPLEPLDHLGERQEAPMTPSQTAPDKGGDDLLPCPFCGGPARVFQKYRDPKRLNWRVCCDNFDSERGELCDMAIYSDFESEAEAIAAWNRRAAPDASVHDKVLIEHNDKLMTVASTTHPGEEMTCFCRRRQKTHRVLQLEVS